jgi:hypothetical protein
MEWGPSCIGCFAADVGYRSIAPVDVRQLVPLPPQKAMWSQHDICRDGPEAEVEDRQSEKKASVQTAYNNGRK